MCIKITKASSFFVLIAILYTVSSGDSYCPQETLESPDSIAVILSFSGTPDCSRNGSREEIAFSTSLLLFPDDMLVTGMEDKVLIYYRTGERVLVSGGRRFVISNNHSDTEARMPTPSAVDLRDWQLFIGSGMMQESPSTCGAVRG